MARARRSLLIHAGSVAEYEDLPCDFADASLVYAASKTRVREIWTLDRDFLVFRLPLRRMNRH